MKSAMTPKMTDPMIPPGLDPPPRDGLDASKQPLHESKGRTSHTPRSPFRLFWERIAILAGVVALWELTTSVGLVSSSILSSPVDVAQAVTSEATSGDLWQALGQTGLSWILGLGLALVIGNVIGFVVGSNRALERTTRLVIDVLRSVPAITVLPLALLMFGVTLQMKLTVIVFGAMWDVVIQSLYATRQVDPVAKDTLRSFGVSRWNSLRFLYLPSAAPFIATGVRLAAIHALLLSVGTEVIGGSPGIGAELLAQQEKGDLPAMYGYIIVAGLLGLALNQLFLALETRLLVGHVGYRS